MPRSTFRFATLTSLAVCMALAVGVQPGAQSKGGAQAPAFQVDPLWPRPLPDHWILGSVTGVVVDSRDHIWLVHRGADSLNARQEMGLATNPPGSEFCCRPAPFVLQFDPAGKVVSHWGGPGDGYEWPRSPGGMAIDASGNVWIAAAGSADTAGGRGRGTGRGGAPTPATPAAPPRPQDAHVLKFSPSGKFLLQIGRAGKNEASETTLNRPLGLTVDVKANEVYVADTGNRRIVVFDAANGAFKRQWSAHGAGDDPNTHFRNASCVKLSNDGLVYVCDRQNNRIQVFKKDGTFVKQAFVEKSTLGDGAVWDIAFSRDPKQQFAYVADGQNQRVHVLRRDTLDVVTSFGGGGRIPGYFFGVGSIAVDSKGNVYTGETYEGKRLQRFLFKGVAAVKGGTR